MTRFAHSVVIGRPLDQVWAFVMEPMNDPLWQGPVIEVHCEVGAPVEVGSQIEQVSQFLGRRFEITFLVTEHEPMSRSSVQAMSGPVPIRGTYRFAPEGSGTRFTMEGETEAHGLFRLAEPVFSRMARREWENCCQTLKELLEAGADAPVP